MECSIDLNSFLFRDGGHPTRQLLLHMVLFLQMVIFAVFALGGGVRIILTIAAKNSNLADIICGQSQKVDNDVIMVKIRLRLILLLNRHYWNPCILPASICIIFVLPWLTGLE